MRTFFKSCLGKKSKKIDVYEEPFINNIQLERPTYINYDYNNFRLEERIKNMCYRWKITRLQALELIHEVDSRQGT